MSLFPSVTEVIGPWTDFSKIPPTILEAACLRGTAVHDVCLNFHAQGLPFVGEIQDDAKGYIASFDYWFETMVAEAILIEERLFDEANGYSGQIDLLCKTKSGELLLVDLKSPLVLSKSWRIQLAAYLRLCEVNGYVPTRCGSLRLSPEGKIPKMDFYEGSKYADLAVFMSCLNSFRYFKG